MKVTVKRKKTVGTSRMVVPKQPRWNGKSGSVKLDRRAAIRTTQVPRVTRRGA